MENLSREVRTFWAASATYELFHKSIVLRERRTRVRKENYCDFRDFKEFNAIERSRPLLVTERVGVTAAAMLWSPLIAPAHFFGDIAEIELRARGLDRKKPMVVDGAWDGLVFL
jgi:hypothetical protein